MWSKCGDMLDEGECSVKWGESEEEEREGTE